MDDVIKARLSDLLNRMTYNFDAVKTDKKPALHKIIPNGQEPRFDFAAVDGSFLPLITLDMATIYMIRLAEVRFFNHVLTDESTERSFLISEGDLLDTDNDVSKIYKLSALKKHQLENLMEYLEKSKALEMASKITSPCIILIDGSLYYQKKSDYLLEITKEFLKFPNISFVAVSKSSLVSTLSNLTDEAFLQRCFPKETGYVEINSEWKLGKTIFAKFSPLGKFFRIDIIMNKNSIQDILGAITCDDPLMAGYPDLLIEAHRNAKIVRDLKLYYDQIMMEIVSKIDQNTPQFSLSSDEGDRILTYHDLLDKITKPTKIRM